MNFSPSGRFTTRFDSATRKTSIEVTVRLGEREFHGKDEVGPQTGAYTTNEGDVADAITQLVSKTLEKSLPPDQYRGFGARA
jgi:hypothetical protein